MPNYSTSSNAIFAIIAFCFPVLWYLVTPKRRYPPGPTRFPIIGSIFSIPIERKEREFAKWGQKYNSDVVLGSAFGTSMVALNTIEAARELLGKRSAVYPDKPRLELYTEILDFDGPFFVRYGDKFREHRRVAAQYFRQRVIKDYEGLQNRRIVDFLSNTIQSPDKVLDHLRFLFSSFILEVAYGEEIKTPQDETLILAQRTIDIVFHLAAFSSAAVLVDLFPITKHLPAFLLGREFVKRTAEGRKTVRAMFDSPYERVKAKLKNVSQSIAARMIDDYTKKSGKPLSEEEEDNVKRMTGQLHTAAADTSYIVAATFILCMVLHPGVYDKVKSELDEVIGTGRLPTMEDKANLPYLDCVIKEVYRWNPPGPLGGIHSNLRDDEYNGYLIPKGSFVIANIWWMMNNPEIYSEPEEFKPERFAGTGSENLPNPKDIIFGFGRRICPGRYLAETNVFLTISHIATCFNIKKARDELGREIDPLVEFTDGGTSCPKDFVCEITPRSDKIAELVKKDQEVD